MDYAKLDRGRILSYIEARGGESSVKDIIQNSTANKLRIYPLLQQMEMDGEIEVTGHAFLGAPTIVWKMGT